MHPRNSRHLDALLTRRLLTRLDIYLTLMVNHSDLDVDSNMLSRFC